MNIQEKYKDLQNTCSCETCVEMCERRPCWPTPEESKKIQDAGFARRMMRDYWVGHSEDIDIISPAIVGHDNGNAPFFPNGRCVFLTEEGLCELHDLGLKPLEGRVASCYDITSDAHKDIAMTWDTKEGRSVVASWYTKTEGE